MRYFINTRTETYYGTLDYQLSFFKTKKLILSLRFYEIFCQRKVTLRKELAPSSE